MRLKQMSLLALLAAPLTSQAALVEMADSELSAVNGQAMFSGLLFNYSAMFDLESFLHCAGLRCDHDPVPGGVQVDTYFSAGWEIFPSWSVGVTGKYSGNTYYTKSGYWQLGSYRHLLVQYPHLWPDCPCLYLIDTPYWRCFGTDEQGRDKGSHEPLSFWPGKIPC